MRLLTEPKDILCRLVGPGVSLERAERPQSMASGGVVVLWGDIWETLPIVCKVPVNKITVGFWVSSSGCGGGGGMQLVLGYLCWYAQ